MFDNKLFMGVFVFVHDHRLSPRRVKDWTCVGDTSTVFLDCCRQKPSKWQSSGLVRAKALGGLSRAT